MRGGEKLIIGGRWSSRALFVLIRIKQIQICYSKTFLDFYQTIVDFLVGRKGLNKFRAVVIIPINFVYFAYDTVFLQEYRLHTISLKSLHNRYNKFESL